MSADDRKTRGHFTETGAQENNIGTEGFKIKAVPDVCVEMIV